MYLLVGLAKYIGDYRSRCQEELTAEAGAAIISRKFGIMDDIMERSHANYMSTFSCGIDQAYQDQAIEDAHKAAQWVLDNWLNDHVYMIKKEELEKSLYREFMEGK